jgi:hypothetical protein
VLLSSVDVEFSSVRDISDWSLRAAEFSCFGEIEQFCWKAPSDVAGNSSVNGSVNGSCSTRSEVLDEEDGVG